MTKHQSGMELLMEAMGLGEEAFRQFAEVFEGMDLSPKGELKHRLNLRVQGVDPGPSVNWRGERGLRVHP